MILVLSFLLFCVVALISFDLFRKRHIFKFSRKFKGYTFYPIIGNGYYTIQKDIRNDITTNIFTVIENMTQKYGIPCNLWNGHDYHYLTADASEIKVVLNHPSTFNKGAIYNNFTIPFKNTLLLAKYDAWKKNRKIFSRSFSQPILNGFVDVFYEKACTLVEILKKSHERDVYDIFSRLSLDNFCANIMSHDLGIQRNKNDKLVHLIENSQRMAVKRMFSSYFLPDYLYLLFFSCGRSLLKTVLELRNIIYKIMEQKKQIFEKNKNFSENNSRLPLMDMILERKSTTFTNEEVFREMFFFILAATDTSELTLSYTFTLLGMNPEVQDKIYQEVCQVVGLEGSISHNHLPDLKYTERALFEAMRLLPAIPFLERRAEADVHLGDKTVPAGANIAISVFHVHRSETYWKDPLEFNPDRFLPEAIAERHPYAFIPFSGGPQNCIGMKYAMMMMKVTVAHVIRNYEIKSKYKSVTDMKFESCITMKTVHELDCNFIPRGH